MSKGKGNEKLSIADLSKTLDRIKRLHTNINSDDKLPIWDGEIYVYSSDIQANENLLGRIPIQVKHKNYYSTDPYEFKEISYPVAFSSLNAFYTEKGAMFFVVCYGEEPDGRIFYRSLLPEDIKPLLDENTAGQKTKALRFYPFPTGEEEIMTILLTFLKGRSLLLPESGAEWPELRAWWLNRREKSWIMDDRYSLMLMPFLLGRSDKYLLFIASSRHDGLCRRLNKIVEENSSKIVFSRERWYSWDNRFPDDFPSFHGESYGLILNICVDEDGPSRQLIDAALKQWHALPGNPCLIVNLWSEDRMQAIRFSRLLQLTIRNRPSAEFLSVISYDDLLAADASEPLDIYAHPGNFDGNEPFERKQQRLVAVQKTSIKRWRALLIQLCGPCEEKNLEPVLLGLWGALPSGTVLRECLEAVDPEDLAKTLSWYIWRLGDRDLNILYCEIQRLPPATLEHSETEWDNLREKIAGRIGKNTASFLSGNTDNPEAADPYAVARWAMDASRKEVGSVLKKLQTPQNPIPVHVQYWAALLNTPFATEFFLELLSRPGAAGFMQAVLNQECSNCGPVLENRIAPIRAFIHEA